MPIPFRAPTMVTPLSWIFPMSSATRPRSWTISTFLHSMRPIFSFCMSLSGLRSISILFFYLFLINLLFYFNWFFNNNWFFYNTLVNNFLENLSFLVTFRWRMVSFLRFVLALLLIFFVFFLGFLSLPDSVYKLLYLLKLYWIWLCFRSLLVLHLLDEHERVINHQSKGFILVNPLLLQRLVGSILVLHLVDRFAE